MPLIIPKDLIEETVLERERIFTMSQQEAEKQDIRPIKIGIVNLMPKKEETELQILRMLSNSALQINIDLIHMGSYESKNVDSRHLQRFYKTYEDIKDDKYDALIITGAPVEKLEYENIKYWRELQLIFEFAKKNVYSTMFICWSAQAALHYYYDIPNEVTDEKIFGVYSFDKRTDHKILKGFDDEFYIPQSRYTYVPEEDLKDRADLEVLAASEETGVVLAVTEDGRFVFNFGHWEYDKDTLHQEYLRDIGKGLKTKPAVNYYREDNPDQPIKVKWRSAGNLFFTNWLNYCVYQETPYLIESIERKNVSKFGGSSLSDARQFHKVRDIIKSKEDRDVIVVSAPGKRHLNDTKVTDDLIRIYKSKENKRNLEEVLGRLKKELTREEDELRGLLLSVESRFTEIAEDLELSKELMEELREVFRQLEKSGDKDFLVSRGEYLNAKVMAAYLNYEFIDAGDLIFLDEQGKLDVKKSTEAIQKRIRPGKKVVVPGFYGRDVTGKIKTFRRGGSDYTGSIIAGALNSNVYENWTDVDGIMTADPKKVEGARRITSLDYDELEKLIEAGAEVYQKDAIEPVRSKNITVRILNTNNPASEGTVIKNREE